MKDHLESFSARAGDEGGWCVSIWATDERFVSRQVYFSNVADMLEWLNRQAFKDVRAISDAPEGD